MLNINYQITENQKRELSAEKVHLKQLSERASSANALFGLLSAFDVSQFCRNCESLSPEEELSILFMNVGKLGSLISDGMFGDISEIEEICENITTFTSE